MESNLRYEDLRFIQLQVMKLLYKILLEEETLILLVLMESFEKIFIIYETKFVNERMNLLLNSLRMVLYAFNYFKSTLKKR